MSSIRLAVLSLGLAVLASPLAAQAGGITGLCGDGTTTSAKSKSGACSNHGGVKTWYADAAQAPAPKAAPAKTAPAPKVDAPSKVAKIPAGKTGKCGDGTFTEAKSKSGACSGHGGVAEWYGEAPAAAAPAPKAAPTAAPPAPKAAPAAKTAPTAAAPKGGTTIPVKPIAGAPAAATALCNDGTYSESQHRSGSCSSHGGVKQWLKEIPPQE